VTTTAGSPAATVTDADVRRMMDRYAYSEEVRETIRREKLLPLGLLSRLQAKYAEHSDLLRTDEFLFSDRRRYAGIEGFREAVSVLRRNGIEIGHIEERELFIRVYRFMATRHILNGIRWGSFQDDQLFHLVFPQPGMIRRDVVERYLAAASDEERQRIADAHIRDTNPHDCNQLLNMPWFENENGEVELVEGSQHKYPQCQLILDEATQDCFAFCTYCFRHAQVRGDEDMFCQRDVRQIHRYLRKHTEVTDILITGGDAGNMPVERLEQYVRPIIEDPALKHVQTVRLGSRALTYEPELVLSRGFDGMLALFDTMYESGIQMAWMAHFSMPRELLNPSTIAAVRRLQRHHVVVRNQSPMMNHVSLFEDAKGDVDVERTARNWIELARLMGHLQIGFHSMYLARPTGEHHYFTAPLSAVAKIADLIHRSLASLYRPTRYISMTSSAGKISLLGTTEVNGEKAFALKFTEGRDMKWLNGVFLAKYDDKQNTIDLLLPFDRPEFFFRKGQREIEAALVEALRGRKIAKRDSEAGRGPGTSSPEGQ